MTEPQPSYKPGLDEARHLVERRRLRRRVGFWRLVAIAALAAHHLPIAELTPLKIKQSIVGTGRASKEQVQHMVCRLLSLPASPNADAADALACALAFWHAHAP